MREPPPNKKYRVAPTKGILSRDQVLAVLPKLEEAVVVVDNRRTIMYLNDSAERLFELKADQVIGLRVTDPLFPGLASLIPEDLNHSQISNGSVHLFIRENGDEFWLKTTTSPLVNPIGRHVGVILIVSDITDLKEMQDESRYHQSLRNEAELAAKKTWGEVQTLIEFLHDPFFLMDSDLKLTYVNTGAERVIGKNREQLLGKSIEKAFPKAEGTSMYRHLVDGETNSSFREFFKPLGIWIDCSIYSWIDNNNNNNIGVHFKDVTESVELERRLTQSEQSYRHLVNSIPDPFFALDKHLRVTFWNENVEKLTGTSAKDAIGKHIRQVLPEASGKEHDEIYFSVLFNGKPQNFTMNIKTANSELIFENYIYSSVRGLSVLCKDVTEDRRFEAELQRYNLQLQQLVEERTKALKEAERLATIGQTAGMVGHDIRNPLQSIVSNLYLAKAEVEPLADNEAKKRLTESLNSIEEQIFYINKIVTDLQDYARRLKPEMQETEVDKIVDSVFSAVKMPENIFVSRFVQKDAPHIITDASFVMRILTNLVTNAIQAMPKGGKLSVQATCRGNKIILTVADSGEGIPEEVKPHLFQPLFTTKSKGQGFGLATVKRLTEALKGTISFESELGKGTTFTVQIPALTKSKQPE